MDCAQIFLLIFQEAESWCLPIHKLGKGRGEGKAGEGEKKGREGVRKEKNIYIYIYKICWFYMKKAGCLLLLIIFKLWKITNKNLITFKK